MARESVDVRYVAKLARIALTDDEAALYGAQLEDLLGHVASLQDLDTSDVAATAQVIPLRNVDRADEVRPSLPRADALAGAPGVQGAFFRVPRILGEA